MRYRSGIGYDVHAFAEGRPLIMGGVEIPHTRGLLGHSDADVLSHAIADAVFGALGEGDIGYWFPPSDPDLEGINSLLILQKAAERVRAAGGHIENIDSTVIAEQPKLRKHVSAMKAQIAAALGVTSEDIGIKATTNEAMGFVGREEGIAAMAVASIALPDKS